METGIRSFIVDNDWSCFRVDIDEDTGIYEVMAADYEYGISGHIYEKPMFRRIDTDEREKLLSLFVHALVGDYISVHEGDEPLVKPSNTEGFSYGDIQNQDEDTNIGSDYDGPEEEEM